MSAVLLALPLVGAEMGLGLGWPHTVDAISSDAQRVRAVGPLLGVDAELRAPGAWAGLRVAYGSLGDLSLRGDDTMDLDGDAQTMCLETSLGASVSGLGIGAAYRWHRHSYEPDIGILGTSETTYSLSGVGPVLRFSRDFEALRLGLDARLGYLFGTRTTDNFLGTQTDDGSGLLWGVRGHAGAVLGSWILELGIELAEERARFGDDDQDTKLQSWNSYIRLGLSLL